MKLIIDAGNTSIKLGVFDGKKLIFNESCSRIFFAEKIKKIFNFYHSIDWAIVSAVGNIDKKDIEALLVFCQVHVLDHSSKIPFKNLYATPDTLGVDRIALASAAYNYKPMANTLVIDAGTCVTYDMVNNLGEYFGGSISPGLQMRYKALNAQTLKLPLLSLEYPENLIGNSTKASIHSGVVNGMLAEIDGIIGQYKSRFADLTVILTGGDAQFLSERLKNTIFANSNFLLKGLNLLLEYNKH